MSLTLSCSRFRFEGMAAAAGSAAKSVIRGSAVSLAQFEHSPITGIHLWFDSEITDLDHAVLLDSTVQWLFSKSRLQPGHRGGRAAMWNWW